MLTQFHIPDDALGWQRWQAQYQFWVSRYLNKDISMGFFMRRLVALGFTETESQADIDFWDDMHGALTADGLKLARPAMPKAQGFDALGSAMQGYKDGTSEA